MQKQQVAQALRQRQYAYGVVPRQVIDRLPDDAIIESSITCPECAGSGAQVSHVQLTEDCTQSRRRPSPRRLRTGAAPPASGVGGRWADPWGQAIECICYDAYDLYSEEAV